MHRMEKQNRAERRKSKFGGGRATDHGGWPSVQPNPVFEAEIADENSADDESSTHETGEGAKALAARIPAVDSKAGKSAKAGTSAKDSSKD